MIKAYVNKTDVNVTTDGYMSTIAAESVQIVNFIYNAIAKEYGEDVADDYVDAVRDIVASDEFAKKKERIANVDGDLIDISSIFGTQRSKEEK